YGGDRSAMVWRYGASSPVLASKLHKAQAPADLCADRAGRGGAVKTTDVFTTRFKDGWTATPDWLVLRLDIKPQARLFALTVLICSKGTLPPTREDLAAKL